MKPYATITAESVQDSDRTHHLGLQSALNIEGAKGVDTVVLTGTFTLGTTRIHPNITRLIFLDSVVRMRPNAGETYCLYWSGAKRHVEIEGLVYDGQRTDSQNGGEHHAAVMFHNCHGSLKGCRGYNGGTFARSYASLKPDPEKPALYPSASVTLRECTVDDFKHGGLNASGWSVRASAFDSILRSASVRVEPESNGPAFAYIRESSINANCFLTLRPPHDPRLPVCEASIVDTRITGETRIFAPLDSAKRWPKLKVARSVSQAKMKVWGFDDSRHGLDFASWSEADELEIGPGVYRVGHGD